MAEVAVFYQCILDYSVRVAGYLLDQPFELLLDPTLFFLTLFPVRVDFLVTGFTKSDQVGQVIVFMVVIFVVDGQVIF